MLFGFITARMIWLKIKAPEPSPMMQIPEHIPFLLGKYFIALFMGSMYGRPSMRLANAYNAR